jgi:hypothetical protein
MRSVSDVKSQVRLSLLAALADFNDIRIDLIAR